MLSAISSTQTNATQPSSLPEGFSQQDKIDAQRSLKSDLKVLTSGQHDVQVEKLTPYNELPKKIEGPTVWSNELSKPENQSKWLRHWTEEEISQLEEAANLWKASGRGLQEIEKSTFPLPKSLVKTLTDLKDLILSRQGFFVLKGLPTDRWGVEITSIAYLGLGSYLGNVVSQNGKGHVLGHVKDIGNDPTQIDKVRIYSTNARQFFHCDSSGGLIGLVCLHRALKGGESDVVSSHAVWNDLQENRPDIAELLSQPIWWFDRKGEVSKNQRPFYRRAIFGLVKGQKPERLTSDYDPYYLKSLTRFVEKGEVPALTEKQIEAMKVLEDTAMKLSIHMELEVGDCQFVSDAHTLHARTEYTDHAPPAPRRHLLRLWLSTPESQGGWVTPYPDSDHPRRGGIQVNDQEPTCPLDAE